MKISIIIATYDASQCLGRCLDSIREQDYTDLEVVLADGGSRDNTIEILKQYSLLMGESFIWLSEPDRGIGDAWNKAVKRASGDWLLFQGADDSLASSDVISRAATYLSISYPPYRVVYGRVALRSLDGRFLEFRGESWSNCSYEFRNCLSFLPHQAVFHHKTLFIDYGDFDTTLMIGCDYDFLLRELIYNKALYIPDFTVSNMSVGGVSTTRCNEFKVNLERIQLYKRYTDGKHAFWILVILYWRLAKSFIITMLYYLGGDSFALAITNLYRRLVGGRPPLSY